MFINKQGNNNSKLKNKGERRFQLLLIIVGFILGSMGTYFWQWREVNIKRNTIAKIIKIEIKRECNTARLLIDTLNKEKIRQGQLVPNGFKTQHDSEIFFSIIKDIGIFNEETIVALDAYVRTLKTCQAMRDFMCKELERVNENVILANDSINVYIHSLKYLITRGEAALEIISKQYPQNAIKNIRKEFLPKVEVLDVGNAVSK